MTGILQTIIGKSGFTASNWISTVYNSYNNNPSGVTLDSSGNVYSISNDNTRNLILLTKYDNTGNFLWGKTLGISGDNINAYAIALDSSNNIIIAGRAPNSIHQNVLVAKFDSAGTVIWQRRYGRSTSSNWGYGVAVDPSGEIYVTGYGNVIGADGLWLIKYSAAGTLLFSRYLTGLSPPNPSVVTYRGTGIALDSAANSYISGKQTPASANRLQVTKYNISGVLQWQYYGVLGYPGGGTTSNLNAVAVDSSGNSYYIGDANLLSPSYTDALILKVDSSGAMLWATALSNYYYQPTQSITGSSIALDSSNNVYGVGTLNNNNYPNYSVFIAKWDSSGALQWQRRLSITGGSLNISAGNGVSIDSSGNVCVVGWAYVGLGPPDHPRFFVAKFPPDGSKTGTYNLNGITFTYATYFGWPQSATSYISYSASNGTDQSAGYLSDSATTYTQTTPTFSIATVSL